MTVKEHINKNAILITGADGYLGSAIVDYLLSHTHFSLYLWVKANDNEQRQIKQKKLAKRLTNKRCHLFFSNLRRERPFDNIATENIHYIIHCAALTQFNVTQEDAYQVNVLGTQKLMDFAQLCLNLKAVSLLSTLYVAGLRKGIVTENTHLQDLDFANYYEWSKYQAEKLVTEQYQHLPWQMLRFGIVIADNDQGHVRQFNVFHQTLKLFYYGWLAFIPGFANTQVYLTTRDLCVRQCCALLLQNKRGIFHIANDAAHGYTLEQLIEQVYVEFNQDRLFNQRQVSKPAFINLPHFEKLLTTSKTMGSVFGHTLNAIAPFSKQLYSPKVFYKPHDTNALNKQNVLNITRLIPRVCQYLIYSKWGKRTPAVAKVQLQHSMLGGVHD